MLKSFKELYNLDISRYVQKKPTFKKNDKGRLEKLPQKFWLDYIEWSMAIFLLYENGAENVVVDFAVNENGYPAFYNNDRNPFVLINLILDDKKYHYYYPVIDGNRVVSDPNQLQIHKAQQRGLVKCIAVNTGLGLKLWQKEEKTFDEIPQVEEKTNKPDLLPDTEKWTQAIQALKNGYTIEQIEKKYNLTDENKEKLLDSSI